MIEVEVYAWSDLLDRVLKVRIEVLLRPGPLCWGAVGRWATPPMSAPHGA